MYAPHGAVEGDVAQDGVLQLDAEVELAVEVAEQQRAQG
jgi:hypothetical protein